VSPLDAAVSAWRDALTAREHAEQAIREAVAAGVSVADLKRAIPLARDRVLSIIREDHPDITCPRMTPSIYLRGAGQFEETWERVTRAMWRCGWATTGDRTTSWHRARGGLPVVLVDFSGEVDIWGNSTDGSIRVVACAAKYRADDEGYQQMRLLPHGSASVVIGRPHLIDTHLITDAVRRQLDKF